jgi:sterol desaturase/sphingolipid hydroxylase (fatty acid hydroxylase superfamily)
MLFLLMAFGAMLVTLACIEQLAPRQPQPPVTYWQLKCLVSMSLYFAIAFGGPLLWDALIAEYLLFDASALPQWSQIGGGFLIYELGVYLWHRTMHRVGFIWRHVHQAHHSAERLDVWGALWFHPLDSAGFTLLGSLALVGVFSVSVDAAITINLLAMFCTLFQHTNIRTPRWIGWFIQRPESHAIHHQRGVHRFNYGDIVWFDMVFGTWRNPKDAPDEAGLFDGASNQLWPLLIGRRLA